MIEGPCDWPARLCSGCCDEQVSQLDPDLWALIQQWAVGLLWHATGRMYGLCRRTFYPCRRECDTGYGLPRPVRIDGEWFNLSCGRCPGQCGCDYISEVILPRTWSVEEIRVDGVVVPDPSAMVAVYDYRRIVRIDGGEWLACQDLSDPFGPGSWSITITEGYPPPPGADIAAGILACELAKACLGDSGCRLPRRLQSITREGVSATFLDTFENIGDLRVGIFEVDIFIESARSSRWQNPTVRSVDVPRPAVLTWPRPPQVMSVTPAAGPSTGGTAIAVTGTGFSS